MRMNYYNFCLLRSLVAANTDNQELVSHLVDTIRPSSAIEIIITLYRVCLTSSFNNPLMLISFNAIASAATNLTECENLYISEN